MRDSAARPSVVVGTAGHIDHGKSALVKALTGTDPDRLKEEQERGITIDLGFAHAEIAGVNVAFVDVPGHERFVRNMLAGVGGIDGAMLVVACDESVMPQTREHFAICRLLRVPTGLVALSKADLVDDQMLELVRADVRELVKGSFLENAPMVPVSVVTGRGLGQLREALAGMAREAAPRPIDGAVRLPIDRVFSMRGFGTVVTGTLVSGTLRADDELAIAPGDRRVKSRGVQVHGEKRSTAVAGERVAVNVGGIEVNEIVRGDSLITPGSFEPTHVLDAVVEMLTDARPLPHGARIRFHQGTRELMGRVLVARVVAQARNGPAHEIGGGASALVRLRLEGPAVVTRGDRFILRAYSPPVTIAGGQVLDPSPPRGGTRTPAASRRWDAITRFGTGDDMDPGLIHMIEESGPAGCTRTELASRGGLTAAALTRFVEQATEGGHCVLVGDLLVSPAALDHLERRLLETLGDYHRANPLSEGMPREEARERVFQRTSPAVFERTLARLAERGLAGGRDRIALATHRVALEPDQAAALAIVERAFKDGGLAPPDVSAVGIAAQIDRAATDRILTLLLRQRTLVKIADLLFHHEALDRLRKDVASLKAQGVSHIDVGAFKERYAVTRKHAIPLLEYLDRERITRRQGATRVIV